MPVIPLTDLTMEKRFEAHEAAQAAIVDNMLGENIVKSADDIAIREVVPGDPTTSNLADFADINFKTAEASNMEYWAEDSSDLTSMGLSSILESNEVCPDNKVICFYGFYDLTPTADLTGIRLKRGSDVLDVWEVEHCYVGDLPGGLSFVYAGGAPPRGDLVPNPIIYVQNDTIDLQMNFKDGSSDKYVGMFALIGEKWGEEISMTRHI